MASRQGSTETLRSDHVTPPPHPPRRALTIQAGDDRLPQGQDQPQRAPEEEEVSDLEVEPAQGPCAVQHGGAARAAGAGLGPQHTSMEAAGGAGRAPGHTEALLGAGPPSSVPEGGP